MADHGSDTVTTCTDKLRSFFCLGVYRYNFGKIIESVNKEKEKLKPKRELTLRRIEKLVMKKRKVLKWLNDVEKAMDELEMLEKKTEIESSSLSNTRLFDYETYWLYDEMLDKMRGLNDSYECPKLIQVSTLRFSFGYFLHAKSTKEASDELLKALEDDSIYIIGLYGTRGSGKTTLAKAVGEITKTKYQQIFDITAFATVSQNIDVSKIQDEIALSLKLKFDNHHTKDVRVRAGTIYSTLNKSSKRILVILDDVREKFELKDIGIPDLHGNCKFLLTTRSQRECNLMGCQREIPLHPLSEEEAWTLFEKHSGLNEKSPADLLNVAHEVASECEGLPGIITNMGSSLRNRSIEVWKASLDSIKKSKVCNQIFLSFDRGDTGFSFTSFLYHDLCKEGFKTFMNDGEQSSPYLIQAIEASWLSIIVLSENYAYSSQCLDELVKILECMKMKNQLVWPIFYKVEPSDIRYQLNSYGQAMAQHEKRFANDSGKIQKWKSALFEVSNLSGKAYKIGYEHEFIHKIIEDAKSVKNYLHPD